MGLGILEDRYLAHVPGTAILEDSNAGQSDNQVLDPNLKYDTSGPQPIVLVPQPSDDPNDPLNWPLWRRDLIMFILSLDAIIASAMTPILSADSLTLLIHFRLNSITPVALLTGWHLFGVGMAGFIFVPTARVYGKRHAFLLGTILLIVSNAWAGAATSYRSILWARIIQGVGGPLPDLTYEQRGVRMALANLSLYGGAFFSPVIAGAISSGLGWRWTFNFAAIFSGVMLPIIFFFCPETAFRRAAHLDLDTASTDDFHGDGEKQTRGSSSDGEALTPASQPPQKKTLLQNLLPFDGRKTDDSLWLLALRPLPLFFQPAIAWGSLIMGAIIGWTVLIGVVLALLFALPPFGFTVAEIGYTYTGAFIGALVGFVITGLFTHYTTLWLVKKNKGVYEPEFRLLLVIPMLIFGCMGVYGFGFTTEPEYAAKHGWIGPVIFLGLEVVGMVIGASAAALYIVDAHRDIAIEAFTCLLMFKNFFSYGLTYKAVDWLTKLGRPKMFTILGSAQVFVCLLTVPMYVFGKRNRSFFKRYDILKILHLDTKTAPEEGAGEGMI
ncbi:hypothetical protein Dda_3261 [Drechslerella dactyloides]|uniref:Major facilitator superfamily (MFS) profile domain-containing protein n=1 Tax=Drechslerella dactyloides TaxID=74499 RepID=A0AAD6J103_DREDA|nr:hypothetical protein Dda_3261 [Drechslerella dactyloides]